MIKLVMPSKPSGMSPVKLLEDKSRNARLVRLVRSGGMSPPKLFSAKFLQIGS